MHLLAQHTKQFLPHGHCRTWKATTQCFVQYVLFKFYYIVFRCVSASVSASTSMTQQLLSGRPPRSKPFRVTNADRSVKKGIMADTLEDLMDKVSDVRC